MPPQYNSFPRRVDLRSRYINTIHPNFVFRPYFSDRDGIVHNPAGKPRLPRLTGRAPRNPNDERKRATTRLLFRDRRTRQIIPSDTFRVELRTNQFMVNYFYPNAPNFTKFIAHNDGNVENVRIDNLQPLFDIEEAYDYWIPKLENERGMEMRPIRTGDNDIGVSEYLISEYGDVYSIKLDMWMVPRMRGGYWQVKLRGPRINKPDRLGARHHRIHRMVCFTFNGDPELDDMVVDHVENDRDDNHYSSLRWLTHAENIKAARHQPRLNPRVVHVPVVD